MVVMSQITSLVDPPFWKTAEGLARPYVDSLSSCYVELRLGTARSERADFLFALDERPSSREAMAADGLEALWDAWPWLGPKPQIWLEYDGVDSGRPSRPSPSLCLVPGYGRDRSQRTKPEHSRLELLDAFAAAVGADPDMVARVRSCAEHMSAIHFSVMVGRSPVSHKLYCAVPLADAVTCLRRVGWRGPRDELEGLLAQLYHPSWAGDELYLDLTLDDLDRPGGNRVGLVLPQQHLDAPGADLGRCRFLSECMDLALCTVEQGHELAEVSPRQIVELRGYPFAMTRWNDYKIVWEPREGLALKVYLGFGFRPAGLFG